MHNRILVTGGAGFIGSNFVLHALRDPAAEVLNLDALTYAGNRQNLRDVEGNPRHKFVHGSINDGELLAEALRTFQPSAVVHFAAETHVDRSIRGPGEFVRTNVLGTYELLEATRAYRGGLSASDQENFRFVHISTDEVYGTLRPHDPAFSETTPYAPNSPYSASKAGSDHLVRAYHHTYGLPTLITNCSNNYGPRQFPEKLIPLMIVNAVQGKALPVYGDGGQVRDWLYVEDHCRAIEAVLEQGRPGETYNVGGQAEKPNLEVVRTVCAVLRELRPGPDYEKLITLVSDRPGHDRRYAIDVTKISREIHWRPAETFAGGIRKTVAWYLANMDWVAHVTSGAYQQWMAVQYAARGIQ